MRQALILLFSITFFSTTINAKLSDREAAKKKSQEQVAEGGFNNYGLEIPMWDGEHLPRVPELKAPLLELDLEKLMDECKEDEKDERTDDKLVYKNLEDAAKIVLSHAEQRTAKEVVRSLLAMSLDMTPAEVSKAQGVSVLQAYDVLSHMKAMRAAQKVVVAQADEMGIPMKDPCRKTLEQEHESKRDIIQKYQRYRKLQMTQ